MYKTMKGEIVCVDMKRLADRQIIWQEEIKVIWMYPPYILYMYMESPGHFQAKKWDEVHKSSKKVSSFSDVVDL